METTYFGLFAAKGQTLAAKTIRSSIILASDVDNSCRTL
jgi:hypothetical protein